MEIAQPGNDAEYMSMIGKIANENKFSNKVVLPMSVNPDWRTYGLGLGPNVRARK